MVTTEAVQWGEEPFLSYGINVVGGDPALVQYTKVAELPDIGVTEAYAWRGLVGDCIATNANDDDVKNPLGRILRSAPSAESIGGLGRLICGESIKYGHYLANLAIFHADNAGEDILNRYRRALIDSIGRISATCIALESAVDGIVQDSSDTLHDTSSVSGVLSRQSDSLVRGEQVPDFWVVPVVLRSQLATNERLGSPSTSIYSDAATSPVVPAAKPLPYECVPSQITSPYRQQCTAAPSGNIKHLTERVAAWLAQQARGDSPRTAVRYSSDRDNQDSSTPAYMATKIDGLTEPVQGITAESHRLFIAYLGVASSLCIIDDNYSVGQFPKQ